MLVPLLSGQELARAIATARPQVRGKFFHSGDQKLYIRGVTYGTFRPDADGDQFPDPGTVARDFQIMARRGINAIRTYTTPPRWLLSLASSHNLHVMVGLAWEQHITFLDDAARLSDIEARIRESVRSCRGHRAVLCYAVGNEIPASIVRWYGRKRIEDVLHRFYRAVKEEDPESVVTYVNYPTTEYLNLPFLDLVAFNLYLESRDSFAAYVGRLQNLAGDRPLVIAEIGLDSRRTGELRQAVSVEWQIRSTFASGCAGAFVFSWTDEWYRGGYDIEDWDFGLTTRRRTPKPALAAAGQAFSEVPFPKKTAWPSISVVVCTYNGERTIAQCLEHLQQLDYPNYEVIVINDGSRDRTAEIAAHFNVRLISIPNGGLSNARNVGMGAALGDIIAYTDDDAYPDPHWLKYLAHTFTTTRHVGVGGPNIPPPEDGLIAQCVANAPGGPIHVLISDTVAEHIPGCNMAFRREALLAIGGFDTQFRTAGDDVDVCWRLQNRGWTLGFNPGAVVWHHRRNSAKAYLKQQVGYGRAEALLERKWPEKYNGLGHVSWAGRLYGRGLSYPVFGPRWRVYHGRWGSAPFQSIYQPGLGTLDELPQTPEWYLLSAALAFLAFLSLWWAPFSIFALLFVGATLPLLAQAFLGALHAKFRGADTRLQKWSLHALTMAFYLAQPLARLWGRMAHGLTPWRRRGVPELTFPRPRLFTFWSEKWHSAEEWLKHLAGLLQKRGAVVLPGGDFDTWDLELRGGLFGGVRIRLVIEEHGGGRQLLKFRAWPSVPVQAVVSVVSLLGIAAYIALRADPAAGIVMGSISVLPALWMFWECATAKASTVDALNELKKNLQ